MKVVPKIKTVSKTKVLSSKVMKKKKISNGVVKDKKLAELKKAKPLHGIANNKASSTEQETKAKKKVKSAKGDIKAKKSKSHQKQLEGLKDIDPEFYDFLKKNDKKLLEFNLFDSDDDMSEEEEAQEKSVNGKRKRKEAADDDDADSGAESDDDADNEEKYHKPNNELEVASDESDFGDDDEDITEGGVQKITLNLLRQWQQQLEKPNVSIDVVRKVIQAFSSALASVSGDDEVSRAPSAYKVVGAAVFNSVVQICVLHLQPAVLRLLGITPHSKIPLHKTKKWTKVRGCLRYYLADLIRLIEHVSSANILSVLLKHLHQMAAVVASFSTLGKVILKRLVVLWSTGDETVRVLAFLCILKITRNQQVSMLHHVLKAMYMSYVRNSKFVSPNTLPGINFMRRSLVEMFALDLNVSYQHAFLYIRQLAINLRNAVILKKKDSFQAIYNWQYVNSLRLWVDVLSATSDKAQLKPLIYPLVTITIGVIRLIPTAQYFPLRFHCLQALISLSKETQIFVPVLPLILEVLRSNTFNRKHTGVSMKPLQFTCILRLNKGQLAENGFRDEVVEQVCGLTLEYLAHESTSFAYSDLVVPTVVTLKSYLKTCRNANYSRKLKQLLDKIQDNARFIDQERRKVTFGLKDLSKVQAWETQIRNKGTPLGIYYTSWLKTHETKKRRQAAQVDNINSDYDVPVIKRPAKSSVPVKNEDGEVELFPSDSEDENTPGALNDTNSGEENTVVHVKKNKKNKQKAKKEKSGKQSKDTTVDIPIEEPDDNNEVDIVKDLDLNDW